MFFLFSCDDMIGRFKIGYLQQQWHPRKGRI